MLCKQCKKNQVDRCPKLQICNSCYIANFRKKYPNKYNYRYGGIERIFKRDNYRCVLCRSKEKIQIHHIDGNGASKNGKRLKTKEQNNNPENLVTLCAKCHNKVHSTPRYCLNGKWSKKYDNCINCGTTKAKHGAKGLCIICYNKKRCKKNSKKIKKTKAIWYQKRGKFLEKLRKIKNI